MEVTMLTFALRRLLAVVPILFLVSLGSFLLLQLAPGDAATTLAGDNATPEAVERIRTELGLDRPLWAQYLQFAGGALGGDFGTSLTSGQPVLTTILDRLPVTLSLMALVLVVCLAVAVPMGVFAGVRANSAIDRVMVALSSVGMAAPSFLVGLILVSVFTFQFKLLPATGYVPFTTSPWGWFSHLILPAAALALIPAAEVLRISRSSIQEALEQDYIRTAWAKGLPGAYIVLRHALRNALSPMVTVLGLQVARIIGGAVVVEKVFNVPGLGTLTIQSVLAADASMIMGVVLFVSVAVVLINMIVDLFNVALNPRAHA